MNDTSEEATRSILIPCWLTGILVIYGFFLPNNWTEYFGFLNYPIMLAVKYIPAIKNVANVSTIPNFVHGFMGVSVYLPLLYLVYWLWIIFFTDYISRNYEFLSKFCKKGTSLLTIFCRIFVLMLLFCFLYIMPIPGIDRTLTYTDRLVYIMVQNRFLFSLAGSFASWLASMMIFAIFIDIIRVICHVKET